MKIEINITTVNKLADEINDSYFSAIEAPVFEFSAEVSGKTGKNILKNSLIKEVLRIKKGMQILFIKNSDSFAFYNGSLGQIIEISNKGRDSIVIVKLDDGRIIKVGIAAWQDFKYITRQKGKQRKQEKITEGKVMQFPFIPGWAFSVHKSQGLTFDKMLFDNRRKVFENGQLYVALSRCRSLDGITITKPLTSQDIKVDRRIVSYWQECEDDTRYLELWSEIKDCSNESEYENEEDFEELVDAINDLVAEL